jgi:hypothetical protein
MSAVFLQMAMDLDKWTSQSDGFYPPEALLSDIWRATGAPLPFTPNGVNALLRQLQMFSFFQQSPAVQQLTPLRFTVPNGIKTVGDLNQFLEQLATPDPVLIHLEAAIDRWSGIEGGDYGPGAELNGLWIRSVGNAIPYFPVGIDRLIGGIRHQPIFRQCPRALQLSRPMFNPGGIRIVGQLYDHLTPCRP